MTDAPWTDETVDTAAARIPRVSTELRFADRFGSFKARWAIGRMRYTLEPGLYAVGNPGPESPVLVTANYKMSFDHLRCELAGIDAWIMVLDTKGINVWCAAGKGTFGTEEIVKRIEAVGLDRVVSHRKLVLPQLGAPGVSAHEVRRQSGFRVIYGPVRAKDLPAFLAAGMKATPEMRRVRFDFLDRVTLIPVELVMGAKYTIFVAICLFLLAGVGRDGYSSARAVSVGLPTAGLLLGTYLAAIMLTPALLPWLPGRAFSVKGIWIGLAVLLVTAHIWTGLEYDESLLKPIAWVMIIPAVSSFFAMNFTGASTYTSLAGVRREMRIAVPLQAFGAIGGVFLWLVGRFI